MTKRRSFTALVAIAALASLALLAQQPSDKVKAIGGKFQCMCGCNQILSQCNHVGCSTSKAMLKELSAWVARGDSDTTISQAFVQEFGTSSRASPLSRRARDRRLMAAASLRIYSTRYRGITTCS